MKLALEELGFGPCHHMERWMEIAGPNRDVGVCGRWESGLDEGLRGLSFGCRLATAAFCRELAAAYLTSPAESFSTQSIVIRKAAEPLWCAARISLASKLGRLLDLVQWVRRDLSDLRPRDMIDLQSFLWVQASDEYPD